MPARLFGTDGPPVTSAKGVLGHTMGAAGAMEAALTALTVSHGACRPPRTSTAPSPNRPHSAWSSAPLATGRCRRR
ncbi:hypothetical protein OG422_30525 [Streptomyces sp. NBC_01525]|uniref:hypothetical protein n=1 Tax=Streptomyces sp. NBC_01525 TaxID=2903893 RepID=UPI00386FCC7B